MSSLSLSIIGITILVMYFTLLATTLYTIITDRGDPLKTISWIIVMVLFPVIGFLLYMVFGRSYRKRKIFTKKLFASFAEHKKILKAQLAEFSISGDHHREEVNRNRETITLLLNSSRSPVTVNNQVEVLHNATVTFDRILQQIKRAKVFVHLEYYIVKDDEIGNKIADLLIEKVRQGVEVRFIYDDVGSWGLSKKYVNRLRQAGVQIVPFMEVIFPLLTSRINNRNHRKIIVIDGDVGFTGGINIADKYIHGIEGIGIWRDTHLMIRGEAVLSLHAIFATDWLFLTKEHLSAERHFNIPEGRFYGDCYMQIATSGPDSDWESIMQTFFSVITKAHKHIYISTPYFLPNSSILTAIKVAAMSGVDVRLMIPYQSDSKLVYWATCSYIDELLEAKVKIYQYKTGFNHSKIIMIDSMFSSVGTANMDVRSFEANFEVSAMIYDKQITNELEKTFLEDLKQSEQISLKRWRDRKVKRNFLEGLARLFTPLL